MSTLGQHNDIMPRHKKIENNNVKKNIVKLKSTAKELAMVCLQVKDDLISKQCLIIDLISKQCSIISNVA